MPKVALVEPALAEFGPVSADADSTGVSESKAVAARNAASLPKWRERRGRVVLVLFLVGITASSGRAETVLAEGSGAGAGQWGRG
jgi:hypothetical protein